MYDKFKYILELQEQGLTRHKIKEKLGYKSIDSLTKFLKKRGYSFDNRLNKYTPIDDSSMTNVTRKPKKVEEEGIVLSDDKGMTEVIEVVSQGIKIKLPKSETIRTTIRINKSTWDRFDKFAQNNKEFNKQDLMAQALEEYINKFS